MRSAFLLAAFLAVPLAAQTTFIEEGRAALSRDDPESAVHLLEKAVAQAPDNLFLVQEAGVTQLTQGGQKARIPGLSLGQ